MKPLATLLLIATSTVSLSAMTKFSQTPVNFKEPVIHTHSGDDGGYELPLPDPNSPKMPGT